MKLLHKTGLYYLIATIIMYLIGSLAFYQVLRHQLRGDTIEKIYDDKAALIKNVSHLDSLSNVIVADNAITFTPIAFTDMVVEQLKDTDMLDSSDNEMDSYLQLQFKVITKHTAYKAVLSKSMAERENLVRAIAYSFSFLMGIFVAGVFFINWWISKKVWGPFYFILQQLRSFNLEKGKYTKSPTDITEFKELDAALETMTHKVNSDYQNLKEFTENASHEIQTPLAGIRSKVELMLQNENLSENQARQLVSINEAVNRLSRLNQSLLLLSKIENEQFAQKEIVDFKYVMEKQLNNLRELIDSKELTLSEEITATPKIKIHPYLLEILISNLLINAIRHNITNGFISIKLDEHTLSIENSGRELSTPTADLFNRFKKDNSAGDSLGIGLSIVRKICDTNDLRINYSYREKVHLISLHF